MYNTKGKIHYNYIQFIVKGEKIFEDRTYKFSSYINDTDTSDEFLGNIEFKQEPTGSYHIDREQSYIYGGDKRNEMYIVLVPTDGRDNLILRGRTYNHIRFIDADKDDIYGAGNGNWEPYEKFSNKYYESDCDDYCEENCKNHSEEYDTDFDYDCDCPDDCDCDDDCGLEDECRHKKIRI